MLPTATPVETDQNTKYQLADKVCFTHLLLNFRKVS